MSTLRDQAPVSGLQPQRILVRGVNWLGDAVMSTPALLRLRARFPEAHLALLTHAKLAELWRHHPAVNEVISFATDEGVFAIGRKLREREHPFDLALVLPNSVRSALEVWVARIPRRVGYRRPWRHWCFTDLVTDRSEAVTMHKRSVTEINALVSGTLARLPSVNLDPRAHHIHQYLQLTAELGANPAPLAPRLGVTDAEVAAVRERFKLGSETLWLGLNAGAEYGPAKRWPLDRFVAAAREIQARTGCGWILFGGKADAQLAVEIEVQVRNPKFEIRNLAGQTSLRELCAASKLCHVLLTNDTGPMHVAAAVGTPVVVPFGSTSSELTGPGLPGDTRHRLIQSDAPCSPCFLRECPIDFRCMKQITPDRVVAAVIAALGATAVGA